MDDARQADRARHLFGRRRRSGRDYAGLGFRRSDGRVRHRRRRRHRLLLGLHRPQAHFGYDDALDAFGVHAVGGATGAILTGVFAVSAYGGTSGLLEGNRGQVMNQLIGVGTVFVYDVVVTLIILKVVDMVIGLRVSEEVEREGLDLALHGETVQ